MKKTIYLLIIIALPISFSYSQDIDIDKLLNTQTQNNKRRGNIRRKIEIQKVTQQIKLKAVFFYNQQKYTFLQINERKIFKKKGETLSLVPEGINEKIFIKEIEYDRVLLEVQFDNNKETQIFPVL